MKIEIFLTPQCDAAKQLLKAEGLAYDNIDVVSADENSAEFQRRLPRVKAVPQIFVNSEHIGGGEDLRLMNEDGRLDETTS